MAETENTELPKLDLARYPQINLSLIRGGGTPKIRLSQEQLLK